MDNAAYFFSGVLAGVAGLTLLAVLDSKFQFINTTPTAIDDVKTNMIIIIKDNCNNDNNKTEDNGTGSNDNETTDTTEDTDNTDAKTNDNAAVVTA